MSSQIASNQETPESKQIARFKSIKERQRNFSDFKIQVETRLTSAEQDFQSLVKKAKDLYKVDSFDELKICYKDKYDENEAILAKADQELADAEAIMAEIIASEENH